MNHYCCYGGVLRGSEVLHIDKFCLDIFRCSAWLYGCTGFECLNVCFGYSGIVYWGLKLGESFLCNEPGMFRLQIHGKMFDDKQ